MQFVKHNGLYYADVNNVRSPRADKCSIYSMTKEDWVQVLDAERSLEEVTNAWETISCVTRPSARLNMVHTQLITKLMLPTLPE